VQVTHPHLGVVMHRQTFEMESKDTGAGDGTRTRDILGCGAYERRELETACACFLAVSEHRYFANATTVRDSLIGLGLTY
jgi:hypothetical protein